MGRTSDRVLGACLLVVRVLTVVTVLAVVAGTVYMLMEPGSSSRDATASTTPNIRRPPRPPTASPSEPPLPPLKTKGTTQLVRRLEVGLELNRLREEVERDGALKARFEERYRRVEPFLLAADRAPPDWAKDPVSMLQQLTEPRRDLAGLVLTGAGPGDPLGGSLRVRAWTLGEPYPADELERVTRTIDHIVRRTGRDVRGGIDVLVTPGMGLDVFPFQSPLPWAAGVYFRKDRYCVTRAGLRPDFRREVVEHECIHAICMSMPSFSSSRFVTEGLAEYLRLVDRSDFSLRIPRDRFADQCADLALLLENLQAHGVNVRAIDPHRLVDLSPQDFYALRRFSYLVAQLTMAYVGGDVIERALAAGSDAAIVAAVRAIQWPEFLEFVTNGAKGGRPGQAVVVEDGVVGEEAPPRRHGAAIAEALRAIGTGWPLERGEVDPALMSAGSAGELGTDERIVSALRTLIEGPAVGRVGFFGSSLSQHRPVVIAPVEGPIAEVLGGAPTGDTPKKVSQSLVALLNRRFATATHAPLKVTAYTAPETVDQRGVVREFRALMERVDGPWSFVFVVDTRGMPALLEFDPPAEHPLAVVVVIDVSEDGEAVDLARKFDRPGTLVAYWRLRVADK